jgi:hypothetical protein
MIVTDLQANQGYCENEDKIYALEHYTFVNPQFSGDPIKKTAHSSALPGCSHAVALPSRFATGRGIVVPKRELSLMSQYKATDSAGFRSPKPARSIRVMTPVRESRFSPYSKIEVLTGAATSSRPFLVDLPSATMENRDMRPAIVLLYPHHYGALARAGIP